MIQFKTIHKSYYTEATSLHVLKGIDLHIADGEMVAIMGSSGSGKSTLLNIIGLLDDYDEGEYWLNGKLMHNLSEAEAAHLRNQMLGFVFQSFNLISFKNALENVALPLYYQKVPRKKRNVIAMEYLDMLGIKEWWSHTPNELSGGQKQRVAIARALAAKPKVILADEPTGALDSKTSAEMMDVFEEINRSGITMVIVTHENDIAHRTKRIIHLTDGMIDREIIPEPQKKAYV